MRTLGYALAIIGLIVLIAYGGFYFVVGFLLDAEIPWIVRAGVTGVAVGVLLVVASLIRERIRDARNETFREVEK